MKRFSHAVCEKIGHYVYILKDPRTGAVFYVGKGKGNRIFQHVLGALTGRDCSDKLDLIREIRNSGKSVIHYILRHSLTSERAIEIESACIDLLGLENLTNTMKGHNSWEYGLRTVDEIAQYFDAVAVTISEPAVIININRRYRRFMESEELYETTRSAWLIGTKRNKVKYAIASFRGLVREVYEIETWVSMEKRWEFTGRVAGAGVRDKYINQSLEKYLKKGSQNPIRYTF